ncbi:hypothetical protein K5D34_25010 [Pseudomonas cichorii]|nr:hypothetical protein [Pseudomonas cichorii]MBX8512953.1 hypothetical protein [Pseudomonas cichorii]MBX8527902.1 hypothetical protein [Pseudomonas cichorii]
MSNSDKIEEGIKKRSEYLRSYNQRGGGEASQDLAPLAPPLLEGILDGLPEGLLPVSILVADLEVKIPFWGTVVPSGSYADVTLDMLNSGGGRIYRKILQFQGPLDDKDFPLDHPVPNSDIPHEGVFTLEYTVRESNGNINNSGPLTITIDRTAPYANPDPELAFPAALTVPDSVITDDTFAGGVTEFVCTLPEYPGISDEDTIVVYWEQGLPPDSPDAPNPAFGPDKIPADRKISIPKAFIEAKPNGATFAVYWLTDKAGNVSAISRPAQVDVQLGALPENLKDPEVPLGPLVDLADAHLGVEVLIPAFDNPKGSVIKVQWGGTGLGDVTPGSTPRDVYVPVPWSVLNAEYTGGPGEEAVRVSYQVTRGSLKFPETPLYVDVQADFSVIGPVNPDEPDPVNPTLALVHLTGADGDQDKLTPNDAGKDIVATVPLYNPVNSGEVLKLYWGTREDAVDEFTVVSESAGDPVDFTIPWAVIEAQANNPALPMYYAINSAGGNNPQKSLSTPVEVSVLVTAFDPVSFPDIYEDENGNKTLSCASLYSEDYDDPAAKFGFRVKVPADRDLNPGDVVTAVWQGYEFDGSTSIPATRFTYTHTPLTPEEVSNGFIFLVEPYADHILPIRQGYADVTYTVTPVGGGTPVPADPMPEKQYVSVVRPGNITCEVPPPKP